MRLHEVRLYGALGERFGRSHRYAVRSPAEAVRALCATLPGFRAHLIEHSAPGYKVFAGGEKRPSLERLADPCSAREVIRVVPVVAGAGGNSGALGILLGVALAVVAPYVAPFIEGLVGPAIAGAIGSAVGGVGAALVIGGISQLLFSPAKAAQPDANARPESKPSYAFDGPVNVTAQGNPVPVIYGRLLVGSQVISQGLVSAELAV